MNYSWMNCPGCGCQVAVNSMVQNGKRLGSVRRWSTDRSINDGRGFEMPAAAEGAFTTPCVCGAELAIPAEPSAVGGRREPGLRVDLDA